MPPSATAASLTRATCLAPAGIWAVTFVLHSLLLGDVMQSQGTASVDLESSQICNWSVILFPDFSQYLQLLPYPSSTLKT